MDKVKLNPSPATFPLPEMIGCGLWVALSPGARAVFGVLWDFHRRFPDACHPSHVKLASASGVSKPTVARAIVELEKVGLVNATPSPGPGPNTYRLNWSDLQLPAAKPVETPCRKTPFHRPSPEIAAFLHLDEEGDEKISYQRKQHGHHLSDGCVVRSAREVTVHDWLVAAGIPHWCEVPYWALGITGLHDLATADFVVGPRMLIEVFGLPSTQKSSSAYNEKRRKKERAIDAAGWILLRVEPDRQPDATLIHAILSHWAVATVTEASNLRDHLLGAGKWKDHLPSCNRLDACIMDATARSARTAPQRKRSFDEVHPWKPGAGIVDLLLDESAGAFSQDEILDYLDGAPSAVDPTCVELYPPPLDCAKERLAAIDQELASIYRSLEDSPSAGVGLEGIRLRSHIKRLEAERADLKKKAGLDW